MRLALSSRRVFRTTTYRNGSLRLLSSEFERAQSALKTLPEDPGNEAKLLLYSYFKQGTIGDITTPSPSMFDMVGKAKHNAWSELSGMSKEDAQTAYINKVKHLLDVDSLDLVEAVEEENGGNSSTMSTPGKVPTLKEVSFPRSIVSVKALSNRLETISLDLSDTGVLRVTLDRLKKGNSMNMTMWHELALVFDSVNQDASVRVVILTGGASVFSTGMDLNVFQEMNSLAQKETCPGRMRESLVHVVKYFQNTISGPERCVVPVLASISGHCIGGAVDLITACDMRYCTNDATFCIKETDLAMVADVGTLQRLPKIIGDSQSRELTYTAREFRGEEALRLGLVLNSFESYQDLDEHVSKVAESIASKSPLTIRGAKKTLLFTRDHTVEQGLHQVAVHNAAHLMSSDLMEAMRATMTKDSAKFSD